MAKKIIALMLCIIIGVTLCGCASYPNVRIDTGTWDVVRDIDIGAPYEYIGFDAQTTDKGKNLILHFETKRESNN